MKGQANTPAPLLGKRLLGTFALPPPWGGREVRSCVYSLSSVALTFAVPPTPTANVLSQTLKPDFSSLILWSPGASFSVDGVLPTYLSSTVMSAPSGVDFTSTVGSAPLMGAPGPAGGCATVGSAADLTSL